MALDTTRIRALCFDVDGTLSDTDDRWVHHLSQALAPFKRVFPRCNPQALARWLVMASETPANMLYTFFDRLNIDDELAHLFNFLAQHKKNHKPAHFWVIPGVETMLAKLRTQYPMAVVSARDQTSTYAFLEQYNLISHFDAIATSQTCRYTKPFPDPVIWAAQQLGVHPSQCLMIGDTTVDILAGKAAGAQTVGVLCGFGQEDELLRSGADTILASTAQVLDILLPHS
ncbi:MAG: HAD family hydrolase [Anaerolineae bacterium]|nr:HAD family hydrolase [Anaerolineae bacterium]